jgi:type II secretory pathway pseudopilin PulG
VLAAVAIPMFRSSSEDSKRAALDQNLAILTGAIERYHVEHGGQYPGTLAGKARWETFVQQLTTRTDRSGAKGERYGPYLKTGIPVNPFTGTSTGSTGKLIDLSGTLAWRYDPATGVITAANDGAQAGGRDLEPIPSPIGD